MIPLWLYIYIYHIYIRDWVAEVMPTTGSEEKESELFKEQVWVKMSGPRVRQPGFELQLHSCFPWAGCVIWSTLSHSLWKLREVCVSVCNVPYLLLFLGLVPPVHTSYLLGFAVEIGDCSGSYLNSLSPSLSPAGVRSSTGTNLGMVQYRSAIPPSLLQSQPFHFCPSKPHCNGGQNLRKARVSEA